MIFKLFNKGKDQASKKDLAVKKDVPLKKDMSLNQDDFKKLLTDVGFYQFWFEQLGAPENKDKTKKEVFEQVNDLFCEVFQSDHGRFNSYRGFRIAVDELMNNLNPKDK